MRDARHLTLQEFTERLGRLTQRETRLIYEAVETIVGNRHSYNGRENENNGATVIYGPGVGRAFWVLSALIDGSTVGKTGYANGVIDD